MTLPQRPTAIRYAVLGLTTLVAVMLYLDRFCLGFVAPYIRENLGLTDQQLGFVLDAFFYTYAFGQIPCGWLSDRFGARLMLALFLAAWSTLTGLMGLAQGMTALLLFRFGCGLFEAGAYPSCAILIRRWVPYQRRGLASGVVSMGGRIGGTITPILTAYLMVSFVPVTTPSWLQAGDLLAVRGLVRDTPPDIAGPDVPLATVLGPRVHAALSREVHGILRTSQPPFTEAQAAAVLAALNHLLTLPDLISAEELERYGAKLPEAVALSQLQRGMTEAELARRNRLVLEVAYPDAIRKIYGEAWRPVLLIYGGVGLLLALAFWSFVRDGPRRHALANDAEARLVEDSEPAAAKAAAPVSTRDLWRGILTSRSLWLSAFVQFGTNFGWVFVPNLFPLYLQRVHQVPEIERGWMVSLPFMVGLPVLIVGGWWTDRMTRRLGPRWGRCLPVALTRLVAAVAILACPLLDAPWSITLALCVFTLASDMGIPAIWAYCLDVSGRNVGLVLGWGNMWGNLGAAVSTTTLVFLRDRVPGEAGWNAVFLTCAAVFLVIGVASFGIDATKPIGAPPAPMA